MSSPSEDGPTNGHRSPGPMMEHQSASDRRGSDSDHSDAPNGPPSKRSASVPESDGEELNGVGHAPDMAESDPPTPDDASEDADFDMEESRPSQHDEDVAEDRPSSSGSGQSSKRKARGTEDDFMLADPELYGLRRSVCAKKPQPLPGILRLTAPIETTAATTRQACKCSSVIPPILVHLLILQG